jgi:hypothetical protein
MLILIRSIRRLVAKQASQVHFCMKVFDVINTCIYTLPQNGNDEEERGFKRREIVASATGVDSALSRGVRKGAVFDSPPSRIEFTTATSIHII